MKAYGLDSHIAEIYDQTETQTADVALIRRLLAGRAGLRILEPFCGNGRILLPLASDRHEVVGMDVAEAMLDSARAKAALLPQAVRERVTLLNLDVLTGDWPSRFDLVILGGNCFYELATPEEQEGCVRRAALALRPGGYIYVDNNHMEGPLPPDWCNPAVQAGRFPTGTCADGTRLEGTTQTIWHDAPSRLVRFRRTVTVTRPDGTVQRYEYTEQKHPVSGAEVRGWLEHHGFVVESMYGDRQGSPYTEASPRAIFWACRGRS